MEATWDEIECELLEWAKPLAHVAKRQGGTKKLFPSLMV